MDRLIKATTVDQHVLREDIDDLRARLLRCHARINRVEAPELAVTPFVEGTRPPPPPPPIPPVVHCLVGNSRTCAYACMRDGDQTDALADCAAITGGGSGGDLTYTRSSTGCFDVGLMEQAASLTCWMDQPG